MKKFKNWFYFLGGGFLYFYFLYLGFKGTNELLNRLSKGTGSIYAWALFAITSLMLSFYGHAKVTKEYSKIWVRICGVLFMFIFVFEIIVDIINS